MLGSFPRVGEEVYTARRMSLGIAEGAEVVDVETGLQLQDASVVISGGRGNDILFGESGADVFVFAASALARKNPTYGTGHDEIRDFDFAEGDRIDLRHHYAVDGFADILSGASSDGNDLILRLGSDEIRIEGLALSDLQTAMFIF